MKRRLCSYDMVERPDQAGIHVLIERVPGVLAEVQEQHGGEEWRPWFDPE